MSASTMVEMKQEYHSSRSSQPNGLTGSPSHRQLYHQHPSAAAPHVASPPRVHTLDLKAKLATALGNHGKRYWNALLHFCTGKISREEFEGEARSCLRAEDVHLHNALVLGILYNASSAVPGPSSSRGVVSSHHEANGTHAADGYNDGTAGNAEGENAKPSDLFSESIHPRKRLRLLAASISSKERQRIKASGKPAARHLATGANASSWAGAGADLLEKRRKEEDKKAREAEKRRLRGLHTQIGADDWMEEALQEETARQENRAKQLPVSTLQALLRSSNVPLCSEAKSLPDADSLADLMTSQAVETGLTGGVAADAAALVLAGVQAHLQNLASSIIMAVRSNRPTGGIRTADSSASQAAAGDTSVGSSLAAQDASSSACIDSPLSASVLPLPDNQGDVPTQAHLSLQRNRINIGEDASSRTSTGSNSVASTAPSSLFTGGSNGRHHGVGLNSGSGADSSTISFVSTAATSFANMSGSEEGSERGNATTKTRKRHSPDQHDDDDDDEEDNNEMEVDQDDSHGPTVDHSFHDQPSVAQLTLPTDSELPNRPSMRRHTGGLRPKLALRDAALLLEMSPHVVVEPLGLSAMERLLGADGDEDDTGDDDSQQVGWLGDAQAISRLAQEERLALAARDSALSKGGEARNAQPLSVSQAQNNRSRFVVNQQGPLALILDADARKNLAEKEDKSEKALSPPPAPTNKKSRGKDLDPLSDVVDPVKLLAGLCD